MGVLIHNYTRDIVTQGQNVPHFSKMSGDKSGSKTASNVFQILGDIWKKQLAMHSQHDTLIQDPEPESSFRTTTPSKRPAPMTATTRQANPVHVHVFPVQNTSQSGPPAPCAHVHKLLEQVCKPGASLALGKVKHPPNGRTSVIRLPLMKQDILSHYSSCFEGIHWQIQGALLAQAPPPQQINFFHFCIRFDEKCMHRRLVPPQHVGAPQWEILDLPLGIGHFPGEPYKFHPKPEHKPARHAPRKVPIHLEDVFKEEIKSLVDLGILEEVKEHTNWVNLCVIVEKDSGNHHSPNNTLKRKLRICLDPRDLNEALERNLTIHTL